MKLDIRETFRMQRAWMLMKKYLMDNRAPLLMSWAFVTLGMIIVGVVNGICYAHSTMSGDKDEAIYMSIVFFVGGLLVTSNAYKSMSRQGTALITLTTPASQLEKFAVRWIMVVPGYIVCAFLSAVLSDCIRFMMMRYMFGDNVHLIDWCDLLAGKKPYGSLAYCILSGFLLTQSFYLLGSIVWRKHCFVKTFLVVGIIFMTYAIAGTLAWESMEFEKGTSMMMQKDSLFRYTPAIVLSWLMIIGNYVLTYIRFKEADIIQKW